jgi:hypothetical protein
MSRPFLEIGDTLYFFFKSNISVNCGVGKIPDICYTRNSHKVSGKFKVIACFGYKYQKPVACDVPLTITASSQWEHMRDPLG